jgi:diadenosine tetraphosphate (Ap4A) HIT family hydrolase
MQQTINNVNYKFIPSKVYNIEKTMKVKKTMENDIYEKYEATAIVDGELIVCKDVSQMKQRVRKLVREDFEMYMQTLENRDPKKDIWIYNVIDGISEQEAILYRDDKCIVFINYFWNGNDVDKLQLLCTPTDRNLRSIRSLDASHLPLLEHMKQVTLNVIREKYGLEQGDIKMYFHYEPSTYHLHIHFVNTASGHLHSSVEYSHELNSVMFNLKMMSDYYKIVLLNIRV